VHLDAVGGVAGDMFVAALLDGFPHLKQRVFADLAAVLPQESGTPELLECCSAGVTGKRFGLRAPNSAHTHHRAAAYADLRAIIEGKALSEGTASEALAVLGILAAAEAEVHGVAIEEVHFHEIGDWDSLMDVVAAGSIIAALVGCHWSVSSLPRGSGFVKTAHGQLPVPAPATAAILTGFDWHDDGFGGERVTPTGAAILRHLRDSAPAVDRTLGQLVAIGTGMGTREIAGLSNILRATCYERVESARDETVVVLTFDVDDMTGEEIGVGADILRSASGVLDVSTAMRSGKKGRPLTSFRLLVRPNALDAALAACFDQTSTIGLRWHVENRRVLTRETAKHGTIRTKGVARPGGRTAKAESDDLAGGATLDARRRIARRAEAEAKRDDAD
jgi:uncharacterized protein (TIGR00299 family) protein